jgi:serine protease Do
MMQRTHDRRWQIALASVLLVIIGIAVGLVLSSSLDWQSPLHAREESSVSPVPPSPFVSVADKVLPAVVFIDTKRTVHASRRGLQMPFGDWPFGDFFQQPGPQRDMKVPASGSGFIVDKDGYILTNAHVVSGADDIKVRLHDGREFKAKLVGADKTSDVAVVKIQASGLPTVIEGNSQDVRVGDWAIAIGNPGGLEGTVTVGVISAKGRTNLDIQGGSPQYQDFLQTDAPINFGNSGGPLCNIKGEVIGINTAINPMGQGIGFAIPIELARARSTQLIAHGKVIRGYLGIRPDPLTNEIASGLDLPSGTKGVIVGQVEKDTPAAKAGLQEGDVIISFDGKPVSDVSQFRFVVAEAQPNHRVRIEALRNGRHMTFTPVLIEYPEEKQVAEQNEDESSIDNSGEDAPSTDIKWLGLSVKVLNSELARTYRLTETRGILVTDVEQGSTADDAGIQQKDVIKKVNGVDVTSIRDFRSAIDQARRSKRALVFFIKTGDVTRFVGVQLPGE